MPEKIREAKAIDQDFTVWHDAEPSLALFLQLQSQWVVGMAGATGLNYGSIIPVVALYEKNTIRQRELFEDIQALEHGCLQGWTDSQAISAKEKPKNFNKQEIDERRQMRC